MRVLLAGASGAIGRALLPQLLAAGHEVIGVTRTRGSVLTSGPRDGVEELVADVSDRAGFLERLGDLRADAVVHQLTALRRPPTTQRDMRATNRLRQEGASTLVAAARRIGASKLVAASVFYGYGFADHGRGAVVETAPFGQPDDRADETQLALLSLEQQVRAFGGIALRYGLFYSSDAGSSHRAEVSPVPLRWRGLLPMLNLSDAASSVVAALADGRPGEAYNIADDTPIPYATRVRAIAAHAGRRAPIALPEGMIRAAAPFGANLLTRMNIRVSTDKARDELGWTPRFPSLEAALAVRPVTPITGSIPTAGAASSRAAAAASAPTTISERSGSRKAG